MSKIGIQSSKKHPSNFPILNFCIWKPGCFPFIPWYIPFIKTHSYWVRWEPHQLSQFTEAIPNACSRNWLRPSPWSNVGLAKIPKAFRPSGRGRSGSGLVGGGWSWQPRGVLQKLGDTQTVNLIDHGRKPRLLGLTLFIEKDMAHTFLIGFSIDTYFAHCSAGR